MAAYRRGGLRDAPFDSYEDYAYSGSDEEFDLVDEGTLLPFQSHLYYHHTLEIAQLDTHNTTPQQHTTHHTSHTGQHITQHTQYSTTHKTTTHHTAHTNRLANPRLALATVALATVALATY